MLVYRYDFGQAESLYLEALKLQPDHVLARLALAEVYANIGDMFKAHEALKHAERHHHDSLAKTGAGLDAKTTSVLLHTSDDSAYPRRLVMQIRLAIITSIILHKKALNQPYAGLSAFAKQSAARYDQLLDELQWVYGQSAGSGRFHTFLTTVLAVLRLNRGILCDLQNNSTGAKTLWELVPEHLLGYLPREYFDRQGALQSPRSGGYSSMKPLPGPLFFMWEHTVLDAEGNVAMHGPYKSDTVFAAEKTVCLTQREQTACINKYET